MKNKLDVILPGLLALPLAELDVCFLRSALPSLNRILRFSDRQSHHLKHFENLLADSLGLAESQVLPFASAFVEADQPASNNLLFQAVHLKADMRNAFIFPLDQSARTSTDINHIIEDLSHFFKADCDITALPNQLWLMRLKHCQAPDDHPHILSVTGHELGAYIKQSRRNLPWYQLINEVQMFMHDRAVNQQRIQAGLLPINSLWCWGSGALVPPLDRAIQCYCNDSLLSAFVDRAGLPRRPLTDLLRLELAANNIYIDLSLLEALKSPQSDDWQALLCGLETNLFKPLVEAVSRGQFQFRLRTGPDDFTMTRFSALKYWRKPIDWLKLLP